MSKSTFTMDSGDDFAADSPTAATTAVATFGFAHSRPAGKTLPRAVAPSTAPPAVVKNSRRGIFRSSCVPSQQSQVGSSNLEDAIFSLFERNSMTVNLSSKRNKGALLCHDH